MGIFLSRIDVGLLEAGHNVHIVIIHVAILIEPLGL